jgi:hypothetical protein
MTSTATLSEVKEAFTLEAYGLEIRLWKGEGEIEWCGMLRDGRDVILIDIEADSPISAKRYLDAEARSLAAYRSLGDAPSIFDAPSADDKWRSSDFQ